MLAVPSYRTAGIRPAQVVHESGRPGVMRVRPSYRGKVLRALAWAAALGCGGGGGDQGPPPALTLTIQGQVVRAGQDPVPIPGASVLLREWLEPDVRARVTTDAAGRYQLRYTYNTDCEPTDHPLMWLEASAEGYWLTSTASVLSGQWSDPPIYCTANPQTIDLSLRAPPTITLRGRVTSAGPSPAPIAGAMVRLQTFYNPQTLATTTTDPSGNYAIDFAYPYASPCDPTDDTTFILEASAEGYLTATSAAADLDGPFVSDPPIYCRSQPQTIDLSLEPAPAG